MSSLNLKYFSESEFNRCTPSCMMSECRPTALLLLDRLREKAGIPIILNSAYRSPEYEKKKGRTGLSSHCRGVAFDIRCYDSKQRALLVSAALSVGFNRIGIADSFIHVDCDSSLPNPRIWLYG